MIDDTVRLDWLLQNVSGAEFRRLGIIYADGCKRADIDKEICRVNSDDYRQADPLKAHPCYPCIWRGFTNAGVPGCFKRQKLVTKACEEIVKERQNKTSAVNTKPRR